MIELLYHCQLLFWIIENYRYSVDPNAPRQRETRIVGRRLSSTSSGYTSHRPSPHPSPGTATPHQQTPPPHNFLSPPSSIVETCKDSGQNSLVNPSTSLRSPMISVSPIILTAVLSIATDQLSHWSSETLLDNSNEGDLLGFDSKLKPRIIYHSSSPKAKRVSFIELYLPYSHISSQFVIPSIM